MKISASIVLVAAALMPAATAVGSNYSQGFEADADGWQIFGGSFDATRVASGSNGITSADGSWHAEAQTAAGNWGGYTCNPGCAANGCAAGSFPAGGYTTSVDIYLDLAGGWANNTRFDFNSAVNLPNGEHRRDFIFNGGFYNDADGSPGSGTDRFIVSASFNAQPGSAFAKNPAFGPIAISSSGWYTFQHHFYDSGGGVLAVDMTILDASETVVNTWTRSDPTDIIGSTVGGNRYGWFDYNQFPFLAFDNTQLVLGPLPVRNIDTGEEFATIQQAIDDADTVNGHTIEVDPGTYPEDVVLDKSLTLNGAQAGIDARGRVIGAPDPGTESVIAPATNGITLVTGSAGSVIDGFSIIGGTRSIQSTSGPITAVEVLNNHMSGFSASAMFLNDSGIDITVSQNVMIGTNLTSTVLHLDQDDFDGLHLVCNHILRTGGAAGTGWFVDGNRNVGASVNRAPLITQNIFQGHAAGANVGRFAVEDALISDNDFVSNSFDGLQGGPKDSDITGNTFAGNGRYGLRLTGFGGTGDPNRGAQGNTVTANQVLGNAVTGIRMDVQFAGTQGTNTFTGNYIINNTVGAEYTGTDPIDMEDNWWAAASGPFDATGTTDADSPTCPPDPINLDGGGDPVIGDTIDYCPWLTTIATVTLNAPTPCAESGGQVVVTIDLTDVDKAVVGGQFFLSYDNATLDFVSMEPGTLDFTREIYEVVNEGAGTIDYAVGVEDGGSPTTTDQTMATITFNVLQDACALSGLVSFRPHDPPSRLTNQLGQPINPTLVDLGTITIDTTDPMITCPMDVTIECDESTAPGNTGMATATDNCDDSPDIAFSDSVAPGACPQEMVITRTWTATDECTNSSSCTQTITVDDSMAPMITCPPDQMVIAEAGGCTADVDPGMATATDNCDPMPVITAMRSDGMALGDPYPAGVTTITWTATDACNNADSCMQTITVDGVNELLVAVELQPIVESGPFDRCITFELFDCPGGPPTVVEAVMTFTNGLAVETIEVPCGSYDCITARDRRHTLRRTDDDGDFMVAGTQYLADFTSAGTTDDSLIGGNLNDDGFIDILDFGAYAGEFGENYGTGDTTCATPHPHADVTGDGFVDVADFTFIQINFLTFREANCCGLPNLVAAGAEGSWGDGAATRAGGALATANGAARAPQPVTRISVKELRRRGLHSHVAGDLNRDGWLDAQDIAAFIQGARP